MRRINQALWRMSAVRGAITPAPTVVSVSTASASEGTNLVHTVTLSGAVTGGAATYAFSLVDGTATSGVDYGSPTFSNGVTLGGGNLTAPVGVYTTFTVSIAALSDVLYSESTETYTLSVGGISAGGSILNVTAPVVAAYGADADAGQVNDTDTLTGSGVRYWLDATSGSDSNAGTSSGAAFQTLAKVYNYTVVSGAPALAGSGFMLKRDDTYDGFLNFNKGALSTSAYLAGAWSTGAKPIIRLLNSASLNNANNAVAWANRGGSKLRNLALNGQNVVQLTTGALTGSAPTVGMTITGSTSGATSTYQYAFGSVYVAALTGLPLLFANGETLSWSGGSAPLNATPSAATGVWFKDFGGWEVTSCDIYNMAGHGVLLGTNGAAGTANNAVVTQNKIYDCSRGSSNGGGIDGGGGDNVSITYNTVYNCGIASYLTNHNIYVQNLTNSLIANNWAYMTANWGNSAMVVHGVCDTVTIEDNLFEKCQNGLAINDGYGTYEVFNAFTIRRNINRLHGTLSGQTQGLAMELACMTNSAIYNNQHYGCNGPYSLAAKRASGGSDASSVNVTISHETVYNCTDTFDTFKLTGAMTGIVVQNSIFMTTSASSRILNVDAAAYPGVVIRNCIFYAPNNAGNSVIWNGTAMTLAAWMAAYGTGNNCKAVDPLFVDAAGGDYRLQAGSPAKLAGYNSGISTDFAGAARSATTPSIGAYE